LSWGGKKVGRETRGRKKDLVGTHEKLYHLTNAVESFPD